MGKRRRIATPSESSVEEEVDELEENEADAEELEGARVAMTSDLQKGVPSFAIQEDPWHAIEWHVNLMACHVN